jgi:hypothetical protein
MALLSRGLIAVVLLSVLCGVTDVRALMGAISYWSIAFPPESFLQRAGGTTLKTLGILAASIAGRVLSITGRCRRVTRFVRPSEGKMVWPVSFPTF